MLPSAVGRSSPSTPWPGSLVQYEKNVNESMVASLLQYAETQLAEHESAIRINLQRLTQPVSLDLLWPGSSFGATACGGQFQVLSLLEQRGVLRIGNIMGASGGATSLAFALADNSSRTLIRSQHSSSAMLCRVVRTIQVWPCCAISHSLVP